MRCNLASLEVKQVKRAAQNKYHVAAWFLLLNVLKQVVVFNSDLPAARQSRVFERC